MMAWTVPDTFAESHLTKQAEDSKTAWYQGLEKTHIFFPAAIETAGSWDQQPLNWCKKSRDAPLSSQRTAD